MLGRGRGVGAARRPPALHRNAGALTLVSSKAVTMAGQSLRRDAGRLGLLFASLGGMIGSGWLFGALKAAKIAGPASLISWVIGGCAVLLLGFVFAELSTMFPRPGAVIVFPKLCFGMLAARIFSWINFLAYVSVAPVEAVAVLTYANNFYPGLVAPDSGVLTGLGFAAAVAMMLLFAVINLAAIRLVLKFNNAVTWWKLLVPAATIAALIGTHFRVANFTQFGFAPAGAAGILTAVSSSGILFTYLGFRQAIELAGETDNPARSLPFAILGSVLIAMLLYLGLQAAFIGALAPADLAQGWAHVSFKGASGPFAGLASGLGLTWLAVTLYIDAGISPSGTGVIYQTTAARVIYATADEGLFPKRLACISAAGVPVASLALSFFVGLLFLLPLPSWQTLVTYLSSIGVLAYGVAPVVLLGFRHTLPEGDYPRPFRLRAAMVVAPAAFIVANMIVFWAGAVVASTLFGGLAVAFALYCAWRGATRADLTTLEWRGAAWIFPYFFGLWLITYLGPTKGLALYGQLTGSALIAILSLAVLWLARLCALPAPVEARERYKAS
jgi:amino acid transporter